MTSGTSLLRYKFKYSPKIYIPHSDGGKYILKVPSSLEIKNFGDSEQETGSDMNSLSRELCIFLPCSNNLVGSDLRVIFLMTSC